MRFQPQFLSWKVKQAKLGLPILLKKRQNLFSYTMQLKLTEVKRLLQSTDITLDDIAWHLGFSNGNYFSKVFKKNCQMSPSEYLNVQL